MCNLYNIKSNREAILALSRGMADRSGWNEPSLKVYPNYRAPVVRNTSDGVRELVMLNWGMPTPPWEIARELQRPLPNELLTVVPEEGKPDDVA